MIIETLLYNGEIHTLDPDQPKVSALAIHGERILTSGDDASLLALAGPQTRRVNLEGRCVLPGLVDAHIHWENTAKYRHSVFLGGVASLGVALERIATRLATLDPEEWLLGNGWAQADWDPPHFPAHADLDRLTGDRPAYLVTKSGHAAWVNSAALRLAGINRHTEDPAGGKIGRDAQGEPDGILFEAPAMQLVSRHIPKLTPATLAAWMLEAQQGAWASGLVGLHDYDNPSCLVALQLLREAGTLGLRVIKQINDPFIEHAHALGLRAGFGDAWLRLGALKIFADGALGPRTAWMLA
ncbi:MAG: amidohydrolase family protein, partial [Anaerolineae bacterium]|nr:amidohydrolase family protein [Anaerolineae bacterium]